MGRKSLEEISPEYRFVKAEMQKQREMLEAFKRAQEFRRACLVRWAADRGLSTYAIRRVVTGNYESLQQDVKRGAQLAGYGMIERKLDEEFNKTEGVGNDWPTED